MSEMRAAALIYEFPQVIRFRPKVDSQSFTAPATGSCCLAKSQILACQLSCICGWLGPQSLILSFLLAEVGHLERTPGLVT